MSKAERAGAIASFAIGCLFLTAQVSNADPVIGVVDDFTSIGTGTNEGAIRVHGWALDPDMSCSQVWVYIELIGLDANGAPMPGAIGQWISTSTWRGDLPHCNVTHGFEWYVNLRSVPGTPSGFLVRARGQEARAPYGHSWLAVDGPSGGELRFAERHVGGMHLFLRHRGTMTGLARPNDYESYPTVIQEAGVYKMWFAGGPADQIYYAENRSGNPFHGAGWQTYGNWARVIDHGPPGSLDAGLTADPSVVHVPGFLYFMYYTAVPSSLDCNRIFMAVSGDGKSWSKLGPVVYPEQCVGYGAGQSSVMFGNLNIGSAWAYGFVHFFTDTSRWTGWTRGGAHVGRSTDGGWTFPIANHLMNSAPPLGGYTWDFKAVASRPGTYLGAIADPGPLEGTIRSGHVVLTAGDGVNFAVPVTVPMKVLTSNPYKRCINNGGLLGNGQGVIEGGTTGFFFGAGYGMNDGDPQPFGKWPPADWDLDGVEIRIH